MTREKIRYLLGVSLSLLVLAVCFSTPFRLAFSFPSEMTVLKGQNFIIDTGSPVVSVNHLNAVPVGAFPWVKTSTRLALDTELPGQVSVEFRLFGIIPIRRVSLTVTEPIMVTPGGHSIGVVLRSQGLLITGLSAVQTVDGGEIWPARNTGLEAGDVIISVNDERVSTKEEFALIIDLAGREGQWVDLLIEKQDGSVVRRTLMPYRHRSGGFQVGLLVKDALAGVGTLTFYDEKTKLYAALGHVISDSDSRRPAAMKEGQIVRATVTGVQPSRKGLPGEVLGTFVEGHDVIGSILQNGACGISGILSEVLRNTHYPEPIPLGTAAELHLGPAEMLTTIKGTTIERFSVKIERILSGTGNLSKSFVVEVTDSRLLAATGGIVQGMSGSPIIQDGYLVGAITHVLVNDPTRGYGTMAEWMAREAYMFTGVLEGHPMSIPACCVGDPKS